MSSLTASEFTAKQLEITHTLNSSATVSLWQLRNLCLTKGGLLTSHLRQKAWPKLVGVNRFDSTNSESSWVNMFTDHTLTSISSTTIDQVRRDVDRSLWHFARPGAPNEAAKHSPAKQKTMKKKQKILGGVIIEVLDIAGKSGEEPLYYYQGYHDVASVFLMTLSSPSLTSSVLSAVSSSHLRDAMSSDFTSLILALRLLIFPMVHLFDPALHSFLRSSGVEPFFALSWVITWFSHDIRNIDTASRLADAFIASHPLLPMYVSVALMIHPECRKFILSTECDFPMVHSVLCSLPGKVMETETRGHKAGSLSWQSLLSTAIEMMRVVPPRNLHRLASKYPFNGGLNKVIRDTAASPIALLGPPPSWGLAGSVPADWALLQIARAKEGKSKTSKAVKRQRGRGGGKVELEYEDFSPEIIGYILPGDRAVMAKVASGVRREMDFVRKTLFWVKSYKGTSGMVSLAVVIAGLVFKEEPGRWLKGVEEFFNAFTAINS